MNDATPKKTSGDLFMEQGHLMGKLMANAEHYSEKPSKEGCARLAADLLKLVHAVGLGDMLTRSSPK